MADPKVSLREYVAKKISEERAAEEAQRKEAERVASRLKRTGIAPDEAARLAGQFVYDPEQFEDLAEAAEPGLQPPSAQPPSPPAAPTRAAPAKRPPLSVQQRKPDIARPTYAMEGALAYPGQIEYEVADRLEVEKRQDKDLTPEERRAEAETEAAQQVAQETLQSDVVFQPVIVSDQEAQLKAQREEGFAIPFTDFRPAKLALMGQTAIEDVANYALGITEEEDKYRPLTAVQKAGLGWAAPFASALEPGFTAADEATGDPEKESQAWQLLAMSPFTPIVSYFAGRLQSDYPVVSWGDENHQRLSANTDLIDYFDLPSKIVDEQLDQKLQAIYGKGLDDYLSAMDTLEPRRRRAELQAPDGSRLPLGELVSRVFAPDTTEKPRGTWRGFLNTLTMGPMMIAEPMPAVTALVGAAKGGAAVSRQVARAGLKAQTAKAVEAVEQIKENAKTMPLKEAVDQVNDTTNDPAVRAAVGAWRLRYAIRTAAEDASKQAASWVRREKASAKQARDPLKYNQEVKAQQARVDKAREKVSKSKKKAVEAAYAEVGARVELMQAAQKAGMRDLEEWFFTTSQERPVSLGRSVWTADPKKAAEFMQKRIDELRRQGASIDLEAAKTLGQAAVNWAASSKTLDKMTQATLKANQAVAAAQKKLDDLIAYRADPKAGGTVTTTESRLVEKLNEVNTQLDAKRQQVKELTERLAETGKDATKGVFKFTQKQIKKLEELKSYEKMLDAQLKESKKELATAKADVARRKAALEAEEAAAKSDEVPFSDEYRSIQTQLEDRRAELEKLTNSNTDGFSKERLKLRKLELEDAKLWVDQAEGWLLDQRARDIVAAKNPPLSAQSKRIQKSMDLIREETKRIENAISRLTDLPPGPVRDKKWKELDAKRTREHKEFMRLRRKLLRQRLKDAEGPQQGLPLRSKEQASTLDELQKALASAEREERGISRSLKLADQALESTRAEIRALEAQKTSKANQAATRKALQKDLTRTKAEVKALERLAKSTALRRAAVNRAVTRRRQQLGKKKKAEDQVIAQAEKAFEQARSTYASYRSLRNALGKEIAEKFDGMTQNQLNKYIEKKTKEAQGVRGVDVAKASEIATEILYLQAKKKWDEVRQGMQRAKATNAQFRQVLKKQEGKLEDMLDTDTPARLATEAADEVIEQLIAFRDAMLEGPGVGSKGTAGYFIRKPRMFNYARDSILGRMVDVNPTSGNARVRNVNTFRDLMTSRYGDNLPAALDTLIRTGEADANLYLRALDDEEALFNAMQQARGRAQYGAGKIVDETVYGQGATVPGITGLSRRWYAVSRGLSDIINDSASVYVGGAGEAQARMFRRFFEMDRNAQLQMTDVLSRARNPAEANANIEKLLFTTDPVYVDGRRMTMNMDTSPVNRAAQYLQDVVSRGEEAWLADPFVQAIAAIRLPRGRSASKALSVATRHLEKKMGKQLEDARQSLAQVLEEQLEDGGEITLEAAQRLADLVIQLRSGELDGKWLRGWISNEAGGIYYGMMGAADSTYRAQVFTYRAIAAAANMAEFSREAYKLGAGWTASPPSGTLNDTLDWLATRGGYLTLEGAAGASKLTSKGLEEAEEFIYRYNTGIFDRKARQVLTKGGEALEQSLRAETIAMYADRSLIVPKVIRDLIWGLPEKIAKEAAMFSDVQPATLGDRWESLTRTLRISMVVGTKIPRYALAGTTTAGDIDQALAANWGGANRANVVQAVATESGRRVPRLLKALMPGSVVDPLGVPTTAPRTTFDKVLQGADGIAEDIVGKPTYRQLARESELQGVLDALPQADVQTVLRKHLQTVDQGKALWKRLRDSLQGGVDYSKLGKNVGSLWTDPSSFVQTFARLIEMDQHGKRLAAYLELRKTMPPDDAGAAVREAFIDWSLGVTPFEARSISKLSAFWNYRRGKWRMITAALGRDMLGIDKGKAIDSLLNPELARMPKISRAKIYAAEAFGPGDDVDEMSEEDQVLMSLRTPWRARSTLLGTEVLDSSEGYWKDYEQLTGRKASKADIYLTMGTSEDIVTSLAFMFDNLQYAGRVIGTSIDATSEAVTGIDPGFAEDYKTRAKFSDYARYVANYTTDEFFSDPSVEPFVGPLVDDLLQGIESDGISFKSEYVSSKDVMLLSQGGVGDASLLEFLTYVDPKNKKRKWGSGPGSWDGRDLAAGAYRFLVNIPGLPKDLRREGAMMAEEKGILGSENTTKAEAFAWFILQHVGIAREPVDAEQQLYYEADKRAKGLKKLRLDTEKRVYPEMFSED